MKMKHFDLNKIGLDFVVGDIHGCFDQLREKLQALNFDEATDRLFSVGDLVDRGEQSEQSIDWLEKPWFHAVRGNHEQIAIDYVNGEWDADNYLKNGGAWFLGLPEAEQKTYAMEFEQLPIAIDVMTRNGLVGIIHAECPVDDWSKLEPELSGERADLFKEICLWDRSRAEQKITTFIDGVIVCVLGHTPANVPRSLGNVLYIDTGAVFGGELTVLEI